MSKGGRWRPKYVEILLRPSFGWYARLDTAAGQYSTVGDASDSLAVRSCHWGTGEKEIIDNEEEEEEE